MVAKPRMSTKSYGKANVKAIILLIDEIDSTSARIMETRGVTTESSLRNRSSFYYRKQNLNKVMN